MFVKSSADLSPLIDNVFSTVALYKADIAQNGKAGALNGTIGSLCDENGDLVALDSYFDHYSQLSHRQYAAYAAGFAGNPDYLDHLRSWFTQDKVDPDHCRMIATMGGSGAISISMQSFLDRGQTIIIPRLSWESYETMSLTYGYTIDWYDNFKDDHFNIDDVLQKVEASLHRQGRALLIINDPAHNPSGYSMDIQEWTTLINGLNQLASLGNILLLNDVAYIDYCFDQNHNHDQMCLFNDLHPNLMVALCVSLSKTATSYGLRLGGVIAIGNQSDYLDEMVLTMKKACRTYWSNPNNSAMINFVWMMDHNQNGFIHEKQQYIDLLKTRSQQFIDQCDAVGLDHYPYRDGFFVTLRFNDNDQRDRLFDACVQQRIYICKVDKGLRVAICSIPTSQLDGLAKRIMELKKNQ